jgi:hypothetical protein
MTQDKSFGILVGREGGGGGRAKARLDRVIRTSGNRDIGPPEPYANRGQIAEVHANLGSLGMVPPETHANLGCLGEG